MLVNLIRREILGNVLNLRYQITFLLFFVLVLTAVGVGITGWNEQLDDVQGAQARNRSLVAEGSETNWWEFGAKGWTYQKRPEPLSVLVYGTEDLNTRQMRMQRDWEGPQTVYGQPAFASPIFRLFKKPDFSFVISVVASLLALLFVYDAISGEREAGTLRLLLTYPVPRDQVLLGKWIGGLVSLAVPLVTATLVGLVVLVFVQGTGVFTADLMARFTLIVVLSLLYVSAFFSLGLFLSAMTKHASTSLIVCLFTWVVLVPALPNLTPMLARRIHPVMSDREIRAEVSAQREALEDAYEQRTGERPGWRGDAREEINRELEKIRRDMEDERDNAFEDQVQLARTLSWPSPAAAYLYAAGEAAGTGLGAYEDFRASASDLAHRYEDSLETIEDERRKRYGDNHWNQPITQDDADLLPKLPERDSGWDRDLQRAAPELGILLVLNLLFFMLAFVRFLFYDPI